MKNYHLPKKLTQAICEEPYRLFFPLGILMGMFGIGHWLLYGFDLSHDYSGFFHAAFQIWLYMGCLVLGFLLTAIPRFAMAPHAKTGEILWFLLLFLSIFSFLLAGQWIAAETCYMVWLLSLAVFIAKRFLRKKVQYPPTEFIWIPVAILHAIIGTSTVIASQLQLIDAGNIEIGRSMVEQGFMLSLVLGVGGFLGPRLMGSYELPSPENLRTSISASRKRRLAIHGIAIFLFGLSFWLEGTHEDFKGYALRALVVTAELLWTRALLLRLPAIRSLFTKLVWISFWMVAVGAWATTFFPKLHKEMLHLEFIGGFSLMTFAVAAMVVLSHSGEGKRLHRLLWIWGWIGSGLFVALILRLIVPFFSNYYFIVLGAASGVWIVTAAGWLFFAVPFLLRVPENHNSLL